MMLRRAPALVWLTLLAGCAGRLDGGLLPVSGTVPGASQVNVLVATTRRPSPEPEKMFSGERDTRYNFADILVSIPPDANRVIGEVQQPEDRSGDPARQFVALRAETLDKDQAKIRFHQRLAASGDRRVLVFIHGYNTRFSEAVFRLAQFAHDSDLKATPVLFTWPSRGRLLGYGYDHESASYSRDALEGLLAALQSDPAVGEIDILAHSMGNWVTLEALRQMAIRDRRLAPKIKQVMLAAPDVDVDVFRRQITQIGENRPPFTLFVSRDDQALNASRALWGDMPRVGAVDARAEPYASMFRAERITPIDLTDIQTPDSLGHTKFAESPEVVRAIGARLASGQTFAEKPGLGGVLAQTASGAVSTVGSAAGLAISAPLSIVDGHADELGDRFNQVGGNLRSTVGGSY
ncbi:Esterase/lipase superfamily enzyme [Rhodoblastus acidophilus]|uniref:Esterase/lipase superfamily enzyme n=1 Tax=Rhodoblastus acidophilus TaxID=1074 RepID=A0A212Q533_RHOAC|nr:alpha/beta hydrolase [Rhodoblastus acidophilus]PPQ36360.1 alpha/beta hydrolase [Rhodoblastus acidophilus]RAI19746.1 alpha/beta hydrolase [Rhodoblastus acidophilus]SNB54458.1 Esterase/lipase superfamily enzyme [Rhodoblastus acidophilus]